MMQLPKTVNVARRYKVMMQRPKTVNVARRHKVMVQRPKTVNVARRHKVIMQRPKTVNVVPINITDSIKHLADRETGEGRLAMIKFPVHTCQTPQAIDQIRKLQPHLFFLSFALLLFGLF